MLVVQAAVDEWVGAEHELIALVELATTHDADETSHVVYVVDSSHHQLVRRYQLQTAWAPYAEQPVRQNTFYKTKSSNNKGYREKKLKYDLLTGDLDFRRFILKINEDVGVANAKLCSLFVVYIQQILSNWDMSQVATLKTQHIN